jgi:FG-GAP-like repeat
MLAGIKPLSRAGKYNIMKKQTSITQIFLHAIAAVIAFAAVSPLRAADPLVAFGDFDNDGLVDVAEVTSPTTITVSLANPDGSYTVSAILSAPKRQEITYISLYDRDGDGNLDLIASSPAGGNSWYTYIWFGHGDGTFGPRTTERWSWPKGPRGFF